MPCCLVLVLRIEHSCKKVNLWCDMEHAGSNFDIASLADMTSALLLINGRITLMNTRHASAMFFKVFFSTWWDMKPGLLSCLLCTHSVSPSPMLCSVRSLAPCAEEQGSTRHRRFVREFLARSPAKELLGGNLIPLGARAYPSVPITKEHQDLILF